MESKGRRKVAAMVTGSKINKFHLKGILDFVIANGTNVKENKELRKKFTLQLLLVCHLALFCVF
jgi:hypothetical protein